MTHEERRVEPSAWHEEVRTARDEGFGFFDWLSAVDETDAEEVAAPGTPDAEALLPGLDVMVHLIDVRRAGGGGLQRLLLRTRVPEDGRLVSLTGLFAGAAWHERETHEMFGLDFEGFDDGSGLGLRPLLLPEGFEGHPLRKSFVLTARASKPWPGAKEPGEGSGDTPAKAPVGDATKKVRRPRRRLLPPGVPDPSWGPR